MQPELETQYGEPTVPSEEDAPKMAKRRPLGPLFHVRVMLLLALGLLFGLLIGEGLSVPLAVAAAVVALLAAVFVLRLKRFLWLAGLFAVLAVGILRVGLIGPGVVPEGKGTVTGRVCEPAELRDDGTYRVYLEQAVLDGKPISGRVRLYGAFANEPRYGQMVFG